MEESIPNEVYLELGVIKLKRSEYTYVFISEQKHRGFGFFLGDTRFACKLPPAITDTISRTRGRLFSTVELRSNNTPEFATGSGSICLHVRGDNRAHDLRLIPISDIGGKGQCLVDALKHGVSEYNRLMNQAEADKRRRSA